MRLLSLLPAVAAALLVPAAVSAQGSCRATSSAQPPAIVELYTSEGCSSCPPADRWLSSLKGQRDVLALAFHVNYWDRLGWADRFATAANTERQHRLQRASGAPYAYTPQVMLNGRDLRGWRGMTTLARPAASGVTIALERVDARRVTATVAAPASRALAGYWATLEDGHATRVKAGENAGETLAHDHVVTHYRPVPSWTAASSGPREFTLELPATASTAGSRRVAFIVTDAEGTRPLQASVLDC
jgi:hypothetical protein